LLSKYDAQHEGLPGKARDLIANEPAVEPAIDAIVLTMEEAKMLKICWIEESGLEMQDRLYPAIYYGIGNRAGKQDMIFLTVPEEDTEDWDDCERWLEIDDYNEFWRPWSSRPTDEQREETRWR
jgi:hypothetical protein